MYTFPEHISKKYKIIEQIGGGTFGKVFKCRDEINQQPVAIKVIDNSKELRQIDVMSKMQQHKNILKLIEYFKFSKYLCIVTQFCSGGDLDDFIKRKIFNRQNLTKEEVLNILEQIAEGLVYLHSKNIMHRDLKPQNIFIADKNNIKIGDFGLSKQTNGFENTLNVGTPLYQAPEIREGQYNLKSDVFSFGCIVHYLIKQEPMFKSARNIMQVWKMQTKLQSETIMRTIQQNKYDDENYQYIIKKTIAYEEENRDPIQNILQYIKSIKKKAIKIKSIKKSHAGLSQSSVLQNTNLLSTTRQLPRQQNNRQVVRQEMDNQLPIKKVLSFYSEFEREFKENQMQNLECFKEIINNKSKFPKSCKIQIQLLMLLKLSLFLINHCEHIKVNQKIQFKDWFSKQPILPTMVQDKFQFIKQAQKYFDRFMELFDRLIKKFQSQKNLKRYLKYQEIIQLVKNSTPQQFGQVYVIKAYIQNQLKQGNQKENELVELIRKYKKY